MKFIVTSTNQVKISSVKSVLNRILTQIGDVTIEGVASNSDVSEQPQSLEETKRGAVNRIYNCTAEADYFVSVESGVEREFDNTYSFTFVAVSDKTKNRYGFGLSTKFIVPDYAAEKLQTGQPLGNIVHNPNGLIALATNDLIKRSDLIAEALISALVPFHFSEIPILVSCPPELTRFKDSLNQIERGQLSSQIRMLDFGQQKTVKVETITQDIQPISMPEPPTEEEYNDILDNGIEAISDGEVSVVILAGGQGSRLAASCPKAMMELDIPSKSTLLELQMRRIHKLEMKYCKLNSKQSAIPTYILTSDSTHSAIAAYLIRNRYFGVKSVKLVKQKTLPARNPENNQFLLSEKYKVLAAPNGNGAVFAVLKESGALNEMKERGVKYVDIHPIDNALCKPADPCFVGAMIYEEGDAALKIVKKVGGGEKIGTICQSKTTQKTLVCEYSELPSGPESEKYVIGNTGMHLFSVEVIEKAAQAQLPYHIAVKREKVIVNDNGDKELAVVHKFERFIFDAFAFCEKVVLYEVKREEEFAPVKNAPGEPVDSPDTAKKLLLDLHKKWAIHHGAKLEGDHAVVEFRPETAYSAADLDNDVDLNQKVISSPTIF